MSSKRTTMSSVDRSWLRMDTAENPMMISAVLVFENPIPLTRLQRTLEERFLRFRRFRQRVVDTGDRVYWEDDPLFDLDNHLHTIALPGSADKAELQALTSDFNSTALDFRRPLWQIHYIDNYEGGCALLIRIHHCIADGISLVRVLLSLTDRTPEPKLNRISQPKAVKNTEKGVASRFLNRLTDSTHAAWEQANLFIDSIRKEPDYPLKLVSTAGGIIMDLAKLGLAPFEPKTSLKGPLQGRKQVAWAEPLALDAVKQCARLLGGTVNDVLLCAATGALSRHFTERDQPIPDCGIRVAVPFNLRPLDQPIETLGNQFGLVLVCLPIEVRDPIMCFRQIQENMNRLKRSYQAQVTYSLLDLFGRGPDILERRALDMLSRKASAVLTNVPGPRHAVYLAGSKLVQPMFWVPQSGSIGIGMSIFSYAGTVQFGMTVDKGIQANPDAVMAYFRESFEALHQAALAHAPDVAYRRAS
ncbi:wax ester/triacylglycerol synthase family O-acyltransferase [Marinobacter daepoensis]|uniref:wax ester/triacylglycerol synthase family O-acyltransferase n=1 Tax=Marinobacter daepoensis TaxID=262077 RepID=UPI0004150E28|nr:wax ester/triacylglycerol synthase family O-acyltransferase [Marinobacter daepoensis]